MEQWQHWMAQGNQAFNRQQQPLAQQYYRRALADVWPIWYHCAFVDCPAVLNADEAALPTHCLTVTLLNLAESYASQRRWRRSRRTLQQGIYWFHRMLQHHDTAHPASNAVLLQQCQLRAVLSQLHHRQLLPVPCFMTTAIRLLH